jgi:hypothetical protein
MDGLPPTQSLGGAGYDVHVHEVEGDWWVPRTERLEQQLLHDIASVDMRAMDSSDSTTDQSTR